MKRKGKSKDSKGHGVYTMVLHGHLYSVVLFKDLETLANTKGPHEHC